jgi:hypothetical protein
MVLLAPCLWACLSRNSMCLFRAGRQTLLSGLRSAVWVWIRSAGLPRVQIKEVAMASKQKLRVRWVNICNEITGSPLSFIRERNSNTHIVSFDLFWYFSWYSLALSLFQKDYEGHDTTIWVAMKQLIDSSILTKFGMKFHVMNLISYYHGPDSFSIF